jgi:hypothetical protein
MFGLSGHREQIFRCKPSTFKIALIGQNDAQRARFGLNRALFSSDHGLATCGPRLAPIDSELFEIEPGLEDECIDEKVAGKIQKKSGTRLQVEF